MLLTFAEVVTSLLMLALKMIRFGKPNAWNPRRPLVAFRSLAMQASIDVEFRVFDESGQEALVAVARGRRTGGPSMKPDSSKNAIG